MLPTVTSIGAFAFAADDSASSGKIMAIKGAVDIKKLDYLGNSAFLQCPKLEKFIARSGEITSIPNGGTWTGAFFGAGLKHLELNCPKLNSVGTYVFKKFHIVNVNGRAVSPGRLFWCLSFRIS